MDINNEKICPYFKEPCKGDVCWGYESRTVMNSLSPIERVYGEGWIQIPYCRIIDRFLKTEDIIVDSKQ